MQNAMANIIMELLRFELFNKQVETSVLQKITPEIAVKVYKVGLTHDVGHLIADALDKLSLLQDHPQRKEIITERNKAVFRFEQQDYETREIVQTLEDAKIPYVLLKGAVIRKNYPQPWMRTSCDVDVLVKKEDFERATETVVQTLGYTANPQGGHDVSLYSEGGVHLELHYALFDDFRDKTALGILNGIWDRTKRIEENGYAYALTDEAFYFYHIAHMAKHFEDGGCGIRSLIDLYYLDNVWQYDIGKRDALLTEGGLLKFANGMRDLARVWFADGAYTEFTALLEEYVLKGGIFGTMDNRVVLQQTKSGGKGKYLLSRIWLPYDILKHESPTLKKHKWLTPFYQVRRWFRMLFKGRMRMRMKEAEMMATADQAQKDKAKRIIEELGLKD